MLRKTVSRTFTVSTLNDGESAPIAYATPEKITIPCNTDGSVASQMTQFITFGMRVGTNNATNIRVDNPTSTPTGVSWTGTQANQGNLTISTSASASGMGDGVTFKVTGAYGGKDYVSYVTVALIGTQKGNEGKGYKAVVTRNNFTESNWATYGESGHSETWSNTSSTRGNCKTGDWFIVVGTATDTKNYHIATYECTNDSGNLTGTCINHQITKDGERGKTGRFYYYAGEWNDFGNTDSWVVSDAQAPYFGNTPTNSTHGYYVFNPDENGIYTKKQIHDTYGDPNANHAPWVKMLDDFKYIITEAIFGQYAQFGSAIINGDWMLSTNGTINGVAYNNGALYNGTPAYTWFDPQYPNKSVNTAHSVNGKEWTGYNFVPNYAVDLLTGATYQQNAYVNGSVITKSIGVEFADLRSMANDSMFVVGVDTTVGGTDISGIWNFKTKYQTIFLPTNRYSNYGQRVILYNPTIGLGGANGTTIVCGEIDNQRLTTASYLRGVGINYNSSKPYEPIPLNSYYRVESIEFLNGVVELMCAPTDAQGQLCEWVVVNIGTNIYRMTKCE